MPRVCWSRGNISYQFRSLPSHCRRVRQGSCSLRARSGRAEQEATINDQSTRAFPCLRVRPRAPLIRANAVASPVKHARGVTFAETVVFSRVYDTHGEYCSFLSSRFDRVPFLRLCPRNLRVHAQLRLSFVSRKICRTRLSLAHTRHARKQSDSLIRSLARSFSLSLSRARGSFLSIFVHFVIPYFAC